MAAASSVSGCCSNIPFVVAVSGGTALLASYIIQKTMTGEGERDKGKKEKEQWRSPPGPGGFPMLGNFLQLATRRKCIPELFNHWANKYGAIYTINLGTANAVILSTPNLICEAFEEKGHIFSDRPNWLPLIKMLYQSSGLTWQNGEDWKIMRQCAMGALMGCGVGDRPLEARISHEVTKLIREFAKREQDGCPFFPMELFHMAVTNILCSIVFGCRYKYKSVKFQKFICMIRCLSECNILDSTTFFPMLTTLPLARLKNAMTNLGLLLCYIDEEIDRHKECFDPQCIRDFIDLYLKESSGEDKDACCNAKKQEIEMAIIDMFVCGSEPTSSALSWAVLCMVEFPDIQKRCHDEIDCNICGGRLPELEDLSHLPYVAATLNEVLRRFTPLPLGIPHATAQPVNLCEFCIPAGTVVICNHQAVHLNESYWNNPCEFDPERFIDDDCDRACGNDNSDNFIPFGIGPRSCIGKELAKNILFLLFTSLLQRFDFQKGCGCDFAQCFEGNFEFTYQPQQYKIKLRVH